MSAKKEYLGDGLYVHHDGYQFVLTAPRGGDEHYVALEPNVLDEFLRFVEKTCDVKISVVRKESADERAR